MSRDFLQGLQARLSRYVRVHTMSDAASRSVPSTPQQWDLLHLLRDEMVAMGLAEVSLDDKGYLFATIPATVDADVPVLGLLAHVDTSPAFNGRDVKPQVVEDYDGGDVALAGSGDVLSPRDFPHLATLRGHTLMTTDGTSLLGADDKAGIAIILTVAEYLLAHPELAHGKIRIGFTPDEEIGRGADHFDVARFGADVAFTLDGSALGGLEYENFNADQAVVQLFGLSVHPGMAKGKMVNAWVRACEFQSRLPPHRTPSESEGREGFLYLHKIEGTLEDCRLHYALRAFDREELEAYRDMLRGTMAAMQADYGAGCGKVEIRERYRNMHEMVAPHGYLIEMAKDAMCELDIAPLVEPIRGGTDGARLSFMGLPTPNLFTGGGNFHGKFEYVSLDVMALSVQVVLGIVRRLAQRER
ncbi:MAG: peptidase T [Cardiobacteriaceae bacterium]|nr:peptidase T [Cardiobacteriaceae bacterium]